MIKQILEQVKNKGVNLEEKKGIFFTGFFNNEVIFSNGVVITNKPLKQTINLLFNNIVQPKLQLINFLQIDIITNIKKIETNNEILNLNLLNSGLIAIDENNKSGVILPGTTNNIIKSLKLLKEKNSLSPKVKLYSFNTIKILISIKKVNK